MEFLALSAPWISDKEFFIRVTGQLLQLLRDALVYRSCGQSVEEAAERLGDNLTEERLLHLYKLTEEIQQKADHKKLALYQSLLVSSYFAAARGIRYGALI